MQCSIAYSLAILCLGCLIAVESKGRKPSGGGGQGTGQVIKDEFGNLEEAMQLLIGKLKTDLKEDSASIRDEVSNLRDDVSNLRDGVSNLGDELLNLRMGESDVRDNLVELKESMVDMKKQLSEISIHDNTDKDIDDNDDTKTNVPLFDSKVCNTSSKMFQEIKDQLKGFQYDELTTERCMNISANSEGKCNESISGTETLKEDLEMMIQEQMKKLVETCQTGTDDQTHTELPNNVTSPVAEDCSGQSDGVHVITTRTGKRFLASCEDDWLILAHRFDGSIEFNLEWASYRQGFGNILREHFIGMDNIVAVLQQKRYEARFDLTTWENETRYAEYRTFDINDEKDKYRLNIDSYSGTAGDSMKHANHDQFSTKDSDNDGYSSANCALAHHGPYWYGSGCSGAHGSVFDELTIKRQSNRQPTVELFNFELFNFQWQTADSLIYYLMVNSSRYE
ncbi:unnamed protein product [Owenia fusiformis]|uniref:Fibrinogen C-terminal domain-containing protein n=1 Tax=Owenia fusiformis TaxID=6347 RepID=A0A8S4Q7S1_OWEFU|nr:unnamed protein product [Owenia fusiformis]